MERVVRESVQVFCSTPPSVTFRQHEKPPVDTSKETSPSPHQTQANQDLVGVHLVYVYIFFSFSSYSIYHFIFLPCILSPYISFHYFVVIYTLLHCDCLLVYAFKHNCSRYCFNRNNRKYCICRKWCVLGDDIGLPSRLWMLCLLLNWSPRNAREFVVQIYLNFLPRREVAVDEQKF